MFDTKWMAEGRKAKYIMCGNLKECPAGSERMMKSLADKDESGAKERKRVDTEIGVT